MTDNEGDTYDQRFWFREYRIEAKTEPDTWRLVAEGLPDLRLRLDDDDDRHASIEQQHVVMVPNPRTAFDGRPRMALSWMPVTGCAFKSLDEVIGPIPERPDIEWADRLFKAIINRIDSDPPSLRKGDWTTLDELIRAISVLHQADITVHAVDAGRNPWVLADHDIPALNDLVLWHRPQGLDFGPHLEGRRKIVEYMSGWALPEPTGHERLALMAFIEEGLVAFYATAADELVLDEAEVRQRIDQAMTRTR